MVFPPDGRIPLSPVEIGRANRRLQTTSPLTRKKKTRRPTRRLARQIPWIRLTHSKPTTTGTEQPSAPRCRQAENLDRLVLDEKMEQVYRTGEVVVRLN